MCIFRLTAFSEVFDLHDLWEHRNVDGGFCRFCIIVTFEDLLVLQKNQIERNVREGRGERT